jgi:hypothetical protein
MFLVDTTIVNGDHQLTYNWGAHPVKMGKVQT